MQQILDYVTFNSAILIIFIYSSDVYILFQIGTWNSTKGAVLIGSVLRNMDDPHSKGSLEGRKLKAVVAMVTSEVALLFYIAIVVLHDKTLYQCSKGFVKALSY